jgi:hypothetical protein
MTSNPIRAIVVRGDFTEAEFAEVVEVIRRIDARRPDAHLEITAVDPETSSLALAEEILRQALPDKPDRETDFMAFPQPRKWAQ